MPRLPFDGNYTITQRFGENPNVYSRFGLAGHNGVDFGLPDGTPVLAPDDAEVWECEYDPTGYGYYLKLRTPAGEDWLLGHLHFWHLPMPGEWVAQGALVGYSNNTGFSTGPHLHLGYRPNGSDHRGRMAGWTDPLVPLR